MKDYLDLREVPNILECSNELTDLTSFEDAVNSMRFGLLKREELNDKGRSAIEIAERMLRNGFLDKDTFDAAIESMSEVVFGKSKTDKLRARFSLDLAMASITAIKSALMLDCLAKNGTTSRSIINKLRSEKKRLAKERGK